MHITKELFIWGKCRYLYILIVFEPTHPFPFFLRAILRLLFYKPIAKMNISFRLVNHNMSIKRSTSASDRFFLLYFSSKKNTLRQTQKEQQNYVTLHLKKFFLRNYWWISLLGAWKNAKSATFLHACQILLGLTHVLVNLVHSFLDSVQLFCTLSN